MKKRFAFLTLVAVLTLCIILSACDTKKGHLTGKIYDKDTESLIMEKALVTLGQDTRTVEEGEYSFENLSTGEKPLTVEVDGYEKYTGQVTIKANETTTHDVPMQKEGPPQVSQPTFNPPGGTYYETQEITISCADEDVTIRYTTDGTSPDTETGQVYTEPITIYRSTTLRAIAYKEDWSPSEVSTAIYEIDGTVANPAFDPPGGTYYEAQEITISCNTPQTEIYYTIDGSEPTDASSLYEVPLTVDSTTVIKAIAYREGWQPSQVATALYTLKVAKPEISLAGGTYHESQEVSISCSTAGASIRYTTDGSIPTKEHGEVYSTPITINRSTTLRAIAYKEALESSEVAEAVYNLQVITPEISPAGGSYDKTQEVTISCATADATIRYTVDGSIPTREHGEIYAGSVTISRSTTLRAIAYKDGWDTSEMTSADYIIEGTVTIPTFDPPAGSYDETKEITISCATSDTEIYYTLDGSEPSDESTLYENPLTVERSTTIKAIAYREGWQHSQVAVSDYILRAVAPELSPAGGNYDSEQVITISCSTSGAGIRYTLDGSTPTGEHGEVYSTPITINRSTTLKAVAHKENLEDSELVEAIYKLEVTKPEVDFSGGTYYDNLEITISCDSPESTIRYTTDGTTPSAEIGEEYTGPITINKSTALKAIAHREGWETSPIMEENYELVVGAPLFNPRGGNFNEDVDVKLTSVTTDATIRYTLDETEPTEEYGEIYTGTAITVSDDITIKAIAYKEGYLTSPVVTATYRFPEVYQTVIIGDSLVVLPKEDDDLPSYPGLSWEWDEREETGELVMDGYDGGPIHYDYFTDVRDIKIRVDGDSIVNAPQKKALLFGDDIVITGNPAATLTLKGNEAIALQSYEGDIDLKGITLKIEHNHTSSATNDTFSIWADQIVVSNGGHLQVDTWKAYKTVRKSVRAVAGRLILEDTATANLKVDWEDDRSVNFAFGVDDLTLNGSGTCKISLTEHPTDPVRAVKEAPDIAAGYTVMGDWQERFVKYYVSQGTVANPTISPQGGFYHTPQRVTISCTTGGAQIFYTTDGSLPTEESALYEGPLTVNESTQIKAIAGKEDWTPSQVVQATYNFGTPYETIMIGGEAVSLSKNSHNVPGYPGLAWEWDDGGQTGQLVMNGYRGAGIHAAATSNLKNISIRVDGNSTVDGGNEEAFNFPNGITIEGNSASTLTVKSNAPTGLSCPDGVISVQDIELKGELHHTYLTDNPTVGVKGDVTVSRGCRLQLNFSRVAEDKKVHTAVDGELTLEDTASANLYTDASVGVAKGSIGVRDLTLNGLGTLEIQIGESWSNTSDCRAVVNWPTIGSEGYHYQGSPSSYRVKYFAAVANPSFTPPGGTYHQPQTVSISCSTEGATIRYTTDGSTPTNTYGTIYTGPITVNKTTTIWAVAYKENQDSSWALGNTYTLVTADPTLTPAAGIYFTPQTVSINCDTPGATIRYTTNGSTPSPTNGTTYNQPFTVNKTTTVKVIAYRNGFTDSQVVTAEYQFLESYGTIKIDGTEVTLPKCNYDLPDYPGLSWEWNSSTQTGRLVMDGFHGRQLAAGTIQSLDIYVYNDSSLEWTSDLTNFSYVLGFPEGVTITGRKKGSTYTSLRLEGNYINVVWLSGKVLDAKNLRLIIRGKQTWGCDGNDAIAVLGHITLRENADLDLVADRKNADERHFAKNLIGISGYLTLYDNANALVKLTGDNEVIWARYGVQHLKLAGTGTCEIDLDYNPNGFPTKAVNYQPKSGDIADGYQMEGHWSERWVKYTYH